MRDGYVATWRGREYDASPDGDQVRLCQPEPGEGWTEVGPRRHVRVIPASEVADLSYVRTTCTWRGEPFIVLTEQDGWLRLEYTGGRAPVAESLRLEVFDFGVYQGWARATEVTDLREQRV
jgi:hypothetical protein